MTMGNIVRKLRDSADRPGHRTRPDSEHPIAVRFSGEIVEKERKRAVVAEEIPKGSEFEIISDEGRDIGGDELAPTPLSYFAAGIGFCLLSQIGLYAKAHGLILNSVRSEQTMRFSVAGSWLRGDRRGAGLDLETTLEFCSREPGERILECVRSAELACFAHQSIHSDVAVRTTVIVNGEFLARDAVT